MRRRALLLAAVATGVAARLSSAGPGVRLPPALPMPRLGGGRQLRLWLPPSYTQDERRYPVVYMHDGQNLFDDATAYAGEWGVDETMDTLARKQGFEAIVVGIDHGGEHRLTELNPWDHPRFGAGRGGDYLADLVGTIKPWVDAQWRTLPGREHTAIVGSSMGGLISHAALLRHPEVFSRAGVLSPAYWTAPAIFADPVPPRDDARLYLSMGGAEGERAVTDARRMHALLARAMGDRTVLHEVAGAPHQEAAWRAEIPRALRWLFDLR